MASWPKIARYPALAASILLLAASAVSAGRHAGPRYIRNSQGRLLGWVQEDRNGERGYDSEGRLVGWYDKQSDTTLDTEGRLVTIGNSLSDLIVQRQTIGPGDAERTDDGTKLAVALYGRARGGCASIAPGHAAASCWASNPNGTRICADFEKPGISFVEHLCEENFDRCAGSGTSAPAN